MSKNSTYKQRFNPNADMGKFGMPPVDVGATGYARNPFQQGQFNQGAYQPSGPMPPNARGATDPYRTGAPPAPGAPPSPTDPSVMGSLAGMFRSAVGSPGATIPAPPRDIGAPVTPAGPGLMGNLASAAQAQAGQTPWAGGQPSPGLGSILGGIAGPAAGGADYSIMPVQGGPATLGQIGGQLGVSKPITAAQATPGISPQTQALLNALRGGG